MIHLGACYLGQERYLGAEWHPGGRHRDVMAGLDDVCERRRDDVCEVVRRGSGEHLDERRRTRPRRPPHGRPAPRTAFHGGVPQDASLLLGGGYRARGQAAGRGAEHTHMAAAAAAAAAGT